MSDIVTEGLCSFIKNSPSCFHTIATITSLLNEQGYTRLLESRKWNLTKGGRYYVTRNGSSVVAFNVGEDVCEDYSFQICASHSDSPTYKIKEHAMVDVRGKYTQLNTEGYGGMIASSWMDRPLSIAGRVMVKTEAGMQVKLLDFDRDMVLIPNVAIHMNREINSGYTFNAAVDMLPLYGQGDKADIMDEVARELNVDKEAILGHDLYLYNRTAPSLWGNKQQYISCPKLDDLECAYTSLQGFVKGHNRRSVQVYACFDNEEVGSGTKQGADSTLLSDVLSRINQALGYDEETLRCAYAHSFMLSADNAHAMHPNHPEKSDAHNAVYMNEGVVIKFNANQKYTSDAISKGIFKEICNQADVPVQYFANRSDMAGGSTLGNISTSHVSIHSVDIGLAQLAMHSSYETAGTKDVEHMVNAVKAFYDVRLGEDEFGMLNLQK